MWKNKKKKRIESAAGIIKFYLFFSVSVLESSFPFVWCYDSVQFGQCRFHRQCCHTENGEETLSIECNVPFVPLMNLLFFSLF